MDGCFTQSTAAACDLVVWLKSTYISQQMVTQPWLWPIAETLHFIGLTLVIGIAGLFDLRLMGFTRRMSVEAALSMRGWAALGVAICGITGVLFAARFNQGALEAGKGHELDAIAAAVIGGTSLMGGSGSVLGVILGACVMGVVSNGLDLLGIPPEPKVGVIGAVIIIAAIVDGVRNRRSAR